MLTLVNAAHPLGALCRPQLSPPDARYPAVLLERTAARALADGIRAAGGQDEIVPVSGWRSRAEQQRIWDDSLAENGEAFTRAYVAAPGCSEHETGLAIDLGRAAPHIDFLRPDFPNAGACAAFRRLAPAFGFIERYRADKQALTGIAAEPWHFRYVGAPHALLMTRYGLCLEEYFAFLHEPRAVSLPDGRRAQVYYLACAGDAPRVPDGAYDLYPTGTGGLVVTVWERGA